MRHKDTEKHTFLTTQPPTRKANPPLISMRYQPSPGSLDTCDPFAEQTPPAVNNRRVPSIVAVASQNVVANRTPHWSLACLCRTDRVCRRSCKTAKPPINRCRIDVIAGFPKPLLPTQKPSSSNNPKRLPGRFTAVVCW